MAWWSRTTCPKATGLQPARASTAPNTPRTCGVRSVDSSLARFCCASLNPFVVIKVQKRRRPLSVSRGGLLMRTKRERERAASTYRPPDCARTSVRKRRPDTRAWGGYRRLPIPKCTTTLTPISASRLRGFFGLSGASLRLFRLVQYDTVHAHAQGKSFWGDQRGSNPRVQSHNLVPKPLGHGHHTTCVTYASMERSRLRKRHEHHDDGIYHFLNDVIAFVRTSAHAHALREREPTPMIK